jgi:hypothetical protein
VARRSVTHCRRPASQHATIGAAPSAGRHRSAPVHRWTPRRWMQLPSTTGADQHSTPRSPADAGRTRLTADPGRLACSSRSTPYVESTMAGIGNRWLPAAAPHTPSLWSQLSSRGCRLRPRTSGSRSAATDPPLWRMLEGCRGDRLERRDRHAPPNRPPAPATARTWPAGTRLLIRRVRLGVAAEQVSAEPPVPAPADAASRPAPLPLADLAEADTAYGYSFVLLCLDVSTPESRHGRAPVPAPRTAPAGAGTAKAVWTLA